MLRRLLRLATFCSTVAFLALVACLVRERLGRQYRQDEFEIYRLNPSTLRFTETHFGFDPLGVGLAVQTAVALPTDDLRAIRTKIGRSNGSFVHNSYPARSWRFWEGPWLWGDYYRCTPEWGINQNGLANTWVLEFRYDGALLVLGVLPAFWIVEKIRRMKSKKRLGHGFPVNGSVPASAGKSAGE